MSYRFNEKNDCTYYVNDAHDYEQVRCNSVEGFEYFKQIVNSLTEDDWKDLWYINLDVMYKERKERNE